MYHDNLKGEPKKQEKKTNSFVSCKYFEFHFGHYLTKKQQDMHKHTTTVKDKSHEHSDHSTYAIG